MSKVWFITGTSKGFGRIWAEAALERGDRVVATARDADTLTPLVEAYGDNVLALSLDVQDKAAIDAAVEQAHARFGRLDVVVNNAGYGLFGTIEEVTEEQARDQLETNVFGALWVTKAALPIMRAQGSGHIIQVSSIGGVNAFPGIGLYHASKWALEGFSQSLAAEVAGFGIKVTIVEPAGFSTDWRGPSAVVADPMPEYQAIRDYRAARAAETNDCRAGRPRGHRPGDPRARRRRRAAAARVLRHRHAGHDPRGVREAARQLGAVGPPGRRGPGRGEGMSFGFETTALEVVEGVDLSGKRAIVTGGASGIGIPTAEALVKAGAEVTLAVRDVTAGERVATQIGATDVRYLELAKLDSVEAFAAGWDGPLHILVNNAGVMAIPELTLNEAGLELQFATNHVGHFALAHGLHGALAAEGARIVSVSSAGHLRSPVIFDDLNFAFRDYEGFLAYGQSKTANVLFAVGATARWERDGIYANALMPGGIATALQRHQPPEYIERASAKRMRLKTPEQGAATSVLLAAHPSLEGVGGRYYENCAESAVVERRPSAARGRRRALRAGRRQRGPALGAVREAARRDVNR